MSTQNEYLESEFRRYFPDAFITVYNPEPEMIEICVCADADSDPDYTFLMEIGSDDDWYTFSDGTMTLTVPLEPEA